MSRKGFASECSLQHSQRWIEVVAAVCGTNSFADPAAPAPPREHSFKKACSSGAEAQRVIAGSGGAAALQPVACGTDAAAALRLLLLKQQPSMVDRVGKNISATIHNSFVEVCRVNVKSISIYMLLFF